MKAAPYITVICLAMALVFSSLTNITSNRTISKLERANGLKDTVITLLEKRVAASDRENDLLLETIQTQQHTIDLCKEALK